MKRIFLAALIALVTLTYYSCKKDNSVKPTQSVSKAATVHELSPKDSIGDQGGPKNPPHNP